MSDEPSEADSDAAAAVQRLIDAGFSPSAADEIAVLCSKRTKEGAGVAEWQRKRHRMWRRQSG